MHIHLNGGQTVRKPQCRTVTVRVADLVPYDRNPRRNDKAVEMVRRSLEEFGYVSRIVVAEDMTVVAGHTRLKAMMELGWQDREIEVIQYLAPADTVRAYRLVDNRSGEQAGWDWDLLDEELESIGMDLDTFFPEDAFDEDSFFTSVAPAEGSSAHDDEQHERPRTTCPYCGREFEL